MLEWATLISTTGNGNWIDQNLTIGIDFQVFAAAWHWLRCRLQGPVCKKLACSTPVIPAQLLCLLAFFHRCLLMEDEA